MIWASEGRSRQTVERADDDDLHDVTSLEVLVRSSDIVLSICPPGAAFELATTVASFGFDGLYLDANAISPLTAQRVAAAVRSAGATYIDGGIVGPPAREVGSTRLYLAGEAAAEIAALFNGSLLESFILESGEFAASALKMAYASWTKGSAALLLNIRALALAEGIEDALLAEWRISQPALEERSNQIVLGSPAKAWRFTGEMNEIALTFESADLPGGFHRAARELYGRLSHLKDAEDPTFNEVIEALIEAR